MKTYSLIVNVKDSVNSIKLVQLANGNCYMKRLFCNDSYKSITLEEGQEIYDLHTKG